MTKELIHDEGSYKLISLTMSMSGRALDISPYVAKLDIYESILSPTVIAEIIVSDATGLFSSTLFTEEEVCISFTTYPDSRPIHYRLNVVDVNPVLRAQNDKSVSYVLKCLNEEVVKAKTMQTHIVRQKIESENIVRQMLERELESKKDLYLEKTKGLHSFVLAQLSPIEAIEKALAVAISEKYPSSAYVFFENQHGFHFKSIEKLVDDGKKSIGDKFFIHSAVANVDPGGTKWRNIIGWKIIQNGNQKVALAVGGYNTKVQRLNLIEGNLEYFEAPAEKVEFVSLNEKSINSSVTNITDKGKSVAKTPFNLYDPDQESNLLAEKYNYLPYYLSHFLSIIAHMTIYGDSTITVGDVITCKIPELNGLTSDEYIPDDPILSGNYLVCKVRHILTFGNNPKYYQALEVVKDGVAGSSPPIKKV